MKKTVYTCLLGLLLLPFLTTGCADDKGNYNYHDLNDLQISFNDAYSAIARDPFVIKPTVSAARDFVPEDYTYEWVAYDQTDQSDAVVLSTDLNLNVDLSLRQGNYLLVFKATNKVTGVFYRKTATLKVDTPTSLGWLLLCSDKGRVSLDMVSHVKKDHTVYHDLLAGTPLEHWQNPVQLVCDPKMEEPFYLVSESGVTRLSSDDFGWDEAYMLSNEFGDGNYSDAPVACLATRFPGKMFINTAGRVYYCNTLMGDGLFGSVRSNDFYATPWIGYNASAVHVIPAFIMWDRGNTGFKLCAERFVTLGLSNSADVNLADLVGMGFSGLNEDLFAWPDRKSRLTLLHMENTRYDKNQSGDGMTYAVLGKVNGTERYLYGMILGDLYSFAEPKYGAAYEKAYYVDLSSCTGIAQAEHFAFSSLKAMMYYAVGRKVYRVNFTVSEPVSELQFELPAGETVTQLKFYLWEQDDPDHRSYDLIVGSRTDGGEGVLRVYEGFDSEGDFTNSEPKEQYGGFPEIVDIIYRENIVYQP